MPKDHIYTCGECELPRDYDSKGSLLNHLESVKRGFQEHDVHRDGLEGIFSRDEPRTFLVIETGPQNKGYFSRFTPTKITTLPPLPSRPSLENLPSRPRIFKTPSLSSLPSASAPRRPRVSLNPKEHAMRARIRASRMERV